MRRLSDIVLNKNPLLLTGNVPVTEACKQMSDTGVGSVLIVDDKNELEGIFTGRDVVHRVIAAGRDSSSTPLCDVMTRNPVCMLPDNDALEALRLMWDGGFRHIPVTDKGSIIGVVSRGDFQSDEKMRLEDERYLWEHMR